MATQPVQSSQRDPYATFKRTLFLLVFFGVFAAVCVQMTTNQTQQARNEATEKATAATKAANNVERSVVPRPPAEHEPGPIRFHDGAVTLDNPPPIMAAAFDALWRHCGRFPNFDLASFSVYPMVESWVPISVDSVDKDKLLRGNTLWYQVHFKKDKPVAIEALKEISGIVCRGMEEGMQYPIK
jgi:hypothetical protein